AHDGDEALGLEDAKGLAQRGAGHAEALDQVGLVAQRVALAELAGDDELAQLVGDLLGLLPGRAPRRAALSHRSGPRPLPRRAARRPRDRTIAVARPASGLRAPPGWYSTT